MPKLPRVSGREATRAFEALGYELVRQRGSHLRLRHPAGERPPLTVRSGLLRRLIRDAGVSVEEFIALLGA